MRGIYRSALLIVWVSWARAQSFVVAQFRPDEQKGVTGYRMAELVIFDQPWMSRVLHGITQSITYPTGPGHPGAVFCATMTPGRSPADPWKVTFDVPVKKEGEQRVRSFQLLSEAKAFVEKECR
jgi:hypothetical protein